MDNLEGHAEAYRDVVHEDVVRIGGAVKAPDYSFRIAGVRKFFVESKKPHTVIKDDPESAFQVRRYAWSAKLPLSILTNFEEFAVYDCRIKPAKDDPASKARVFYLEHAHYGEAWDWINSIFSKNAILKGSFDKFAEQNKTKHGTAEVDDDFLATIETWRLELARNLALRNTKLTQRELNFSVQRIIDRIIFLRICEDRGIENYGRLLGLAGSQRIYARLCDRFQEADGRYNSGLFHFKSEPSRHELPDELTLRLSLDDKLLRDVFQGLYYPDSPYEFSVISADILGQAYEQFLGKVIRLTTGHRAVIEDKPEVKKAGGVYYTPAYIVDYIVQHTLGQLVEGGTLAEVAKLRILDPACGSGSFLIAAYQFLLNWHLEWYMGNDPRKWAKGRRQALVQTGSTWRLTIAERKRILLQNIYGVDIDPQAVEVTKLSLLLKVLEGETDQTLQPLLYGLHERALPDLGDNIKCGNSLIQSDFYHQGELPLLTDDERQRINVFDWKGKNGFPEIMNSGGFDAVIGNPPYIFTRELLSSAERAYFAKNYALSWEKHNTFLLFMEAQLRLLKQSGRGSFIVPNSWLTIESGRLIRERVIQQLALIADLNYLVFPKVSMEPSIFVITGKKNPEPVKVLRVRSKDEFLRGTFAIADRVLWGRSGNRIVIASSDKAGVILERVRVESRELGTAFEVKTGLQAYEKAKGTPPQTASDVRDHVFDRSEKVDERTFRYLEGRDVDRFCLRWSKTWMRYGPWLAQPRDIDMFTRPRILVREITAPLPYCLRSTYLDKRFLNNKSILNVLHSGDDTEMLKALTCILNSRFMSLYYKTYAVKGARTVFPKIVIKNLREFPIPKKLPPPVTTTLGGLYDAINECFRQSDKVRTPHEQEALQRRMDALNEQIDTQVYSLYGLGKDEIQVIEGH